MTNQRLEKEAMEHHTNDDNDSPIQTQSNGHSHDHNGPIASMTAPLDQNFNHLNEGFDDNAASNTMRIRKEGWLYRRSNGIASRRRWTKQVYFMLRYGNLNDNNVIMTSMLPTLSYNYGSPRNNTSFKSNDDDSNKNRDANTYTLTPFCTVSDVFLRKTKTKSKSKKKSSSGSCAASTASSLESDVIMEEEDADFNIFSEDDDEKALESPQGEQQTIDTPPKTNHTNISGKKQTLYCIKITWLTGKTTKSAEGLKCHSEESSLARIPEIPNMTNDDEPNNNLDYITSAKSMEKKSKKKKKEETSDQQSESGSRSVFSRKSMSKKIRKSFRKKKKKKEHATNGGLKVDVGETNNSTIPTELGLNTSKSDVQSVLSKDFYDERDDDDSIGPIRSINEESITEHHSPHHSIASALTTDEEIPSPSHSIGRGTFVQETKQSNDVDHLSVTSVITEELPSPNDPTPIPEQRRSSSASTKYTNGMNSGIEKHYHAQVQFQQSRKDVQTAEDIQLQFLEKKETKKRKVLKKLARNTKYAAAAGAAATASVFTAGIGLAVALAFIGITAAAGSGSAAAEVVKRRKKGRTTVIVAATTLEEAKAWKEAIEDVIEELRLANAVTDMECLDLSTNDGNSAGRSFNDDRGIARAQSTRGKHDFGSLFEKLSSANGSDSDVYKEPEFQWKPLDGWLGKIGFGNSGEIRIFREDVSHHHIRSSIVSRTKKIAQNFLAFEEEFTSPLLMSKLVLNSSALDAFMSFMTHNTMDSSSNAGHDGGVSDSLPFVNSGQRASFRVLETVDEHSDVIHLTFRPIYLFPFWTKPRDFVLFRHWRHESDDTYVIVYHSVERPDCPPVDTHVRGKMEGIFSIAPEKRFRSNAGGMNQTKCLLTQWMQVDPKGWIPKIDVSYCDDYNAAFAVYAMSVAMDVHDALEFDRFVPVALNGKPNARKQIKKNFAKTIQTAEDSGLSSPSYMDQSLDSYDEDEFNNYDYTYAHREVGKSMQPAYSTKSLIDKSFGNDPEPASHTRWAEPDANSFRIRGADYKIDKKKINAGNSLYQLLAVDMIKVKKQELGGLCALPGERVQRALEREKRAKAKGLPSDMPQFLFVINLSLKGPPAYHVMFYFGINDMSAVDGSNGMPFSKLSKEFFFGNSDEFRDRTFKLIPQIIQGNFVVRKAAGSTPVLLGKKLKQYYCRGERFCEVIIDTGSSSVANGTISLCNGYSKKIVVDMAFLLEGNDPSTLPETVFGCARLKNIDLAKDSRPLST